MEYPTWYGQKYPSIEDFELLAEQLGAIVIWTRSSQAAFSHGDGNHPPEIFIPRSAGSIEQAWFIAHELGHLLHHMGPKGEESWSREELTACEWAACALIPISRIRIYRNASEDSMIAALSANYEHIPSNECKERDLAGYIAGVRLRALRKEVA